MPIPKKLADKYVRLFTDKNALVDALLHEKGTRPVDIKAIQKVLAQKFSDPKVMEGLVNDYIVAAKGVKL